MTFRCKNSTALRLFRARETDLPTGGFLSAWQSDHAPDRSKYNGHNSRSAPPPPGTVNALQENKDAQSQALAAAAGGHDAANFVLALSPPFESSE